MEDENKISLDDLKRFSNLFIDRFAKDNPERRVSLTNAFREAEKECTVKPDETEEHNRTWEYLVIKNAEKEGKIYDIDRLFWNDGKLFGYDAAPTKDGAGAIVKIVKDEQPYTISFRFDWEQCCLLIQCMGMNMETDMPFGARRLIDFGMLFGIKEEVVQSMVLHAVEEMMIIIKKMIDDGKKGNRDC